MVLGCQRSLLADYCRHVEVHRNGYGALAPRDLYVVAGRSKNDPWLCYGNTHQSHAVVAMLALIFYGVTAVLFLPLAKVRIFPARRRAEGSRG